MSYPRVKSNSSFDNGRNKRGERIKKLLMIALEKKIQVIDNPQLARQINNEVSRLLETHQAINANKLREIENRIIAQNRLLNPHPNNNESIPFISKDYDSPINKIRMKNRDIIVTNQLLNDQYKNIANVLKKKLACKKQSLDHLIQQQDSDNLKINTSKHGLSSLSIDSKYGKCRIAIPDSRLNLLTGQNSTNETPIKVSIGGSIKDYANSW